MEAQIEAILNTKRRPNETWRDVFIRLEPSGRVDMKAVVSLTALMLDALMVRGEDFNKIREDVQVLFDRTAPSQAVKKTTPKAKPKTKK